MIDKKIDGVLKIIYKRLKNRHLNWVLTGSCSFIIQGIDIEIHDIDIQTDRDSAFEIGRLFRGYVIQRIQYLETEKIRSYFGELFIKGVKVEIMGDIQKRLPDGSWTEPPSINDLRKFVEYNSIEIPVLPLEYEMKSYRIMGREDRAMEIRDFLGLTED